MEADDTAPRCPFPYPFYSPRPTPIDLALKKEDLSPESIKKAEEEVRDKEEILSISEHAVSVYFEEDEGDIDIRGMTFSRDLMKHVQARLRSKKERRKSVVNKLTELFEAQESSREMTPTSLEEGPVSDIRKDIKKIVVKSLEDAFLSKEREIRLSQENADRANARVKIATIGAVTTVCTTMLATAATLILFFASK